GKKKGNDPSERLEALTKVEKDHDPRLWAEALLRTRQSEVLIAQLEIFRRLTINDPHLERHRAVLNRRSREIVEETYRSFSKLEAAVRAAGAGDDKYRKLDPRRMKAFDARPTYKKWLRDYRAPIGALSKAAKTAKRKLDETELVDSPAEIVGAPSVADSAAAQRKVDPLTAPLELLPEE
ncbi:MAG TPA: hypothetical protein VFA96_09100, partial [Nocardioides sp.]|nr:hypothetical protein [Nocardioides sp.]